MIFRFDDSLNRTDVSLQDLADLVRKVSGGSNGIFGVPLAVSFFLLFYDKNLHFPGMRKISELSLDMYLVSFIFDRLYYPYFLDKYFVDQSRFGKFFFILVPLVFLSSFAVAWLKDAGFYDGKRC